MSAPPAEAQHRRAAWAGAAIGFAIAGMFARVVWHIGDEGSVVYNAQRWAQGDVPYRDFFEVMGPLTFAPGMLAFRVLGVSWWASRVEMIAAVALTGFLIARIASVLSQRPSRSVFPALLYVIAVVPVWPGVNYHLDTNAAYLACVAMAMHDRRPSALRLAMFGAATAIVALVMIQKGIILGAVLTARYALDRRTAPAVRIGQIATLAGAAAVVVVAVYGYFAVHGALRELVYATLVWPATQYHNVNRVGFGHGLGELFTDSAALWMRPFGRVGGLALTGVLTLPIVAVPALAAVGLAAIGWTIVARRGMPIEARVVAGAGLGLLVSESHRPDIMHLLYGAPLLMVLGWNVLLSRSAQSRVVRSGLTVLHVCALALLTASTMVALSARTLVQTAVGPVYRYGSDPVLAFLQSHSFPGERLFVYPYYPMYYFLGGIRNPTRYSIFMYGINTSEQARDLIRALDEQQVRLVLWDTVYSGATLARWFNYAEPPPDEQLIERYLQTHYRFDGMAGSYRVLRRVR